MQGVATRALIISSALTIFICAPVFCAAGVFSEAERTRIVKLWAEPGRYKVGVPDRAEREGVWQVRLTPEASSWLYSYYRLRSPGRYPTIYKPPPKNEEEAEWENWIDKKIAWDRWHATIEAQKQNQQLIGKEVPPQEGLLPPPDPGAAPQKMVLLAGEPPPFANVVRPAQHTVAFDDLTIVMADNPAMQKRYPAYRFSQGVQSPGTSLKSMPEEVLSELFDKAKINGSVQRVMKAVSLLEGGFDAINTYDTGFLSVGFIQFAACRAGGGSLGAVMLRQKKDFSKEFERDFRQFGVDVRPDGLICCVRLSDGEELSGREAVEQIIEDKRLTAVFQRAGRISNPFRVAQLQIAREQYYPADDVVTLVIGKKQLSAKVYELIHSEAGIATLMDRKVNTGKIEPLADIITRLVTERGIVQLSEIWKHELDILRSLRFRKDYLADDSLSQPQILTRQETSRSGSIRTKDAKQQKYLKTP